MFLHACTCKHILKCLFLTVNNEINILYWFWTHQTLVDFIINLFICGWFFLTAKWVLLLAGVWSKCLFDCTAYYFCYFCFSILAFKKDTVGLVKVDWSRYTRHLLSLKNLMLCRRIRWWMFVKSFKNES